MDKTNLLVYLVLVQLTLAAICGGANAQDIKGSKVLLRSLLPQEVLSNRNRRSTDHSLKDAKVIDTGENEVAVKPEAALNTSLAKTALEWHAWSEWGPCSNPCGNGEKTRYRQCFDNDVMQTDTKLCSGPSKDVSICVGEDGDCAKNILNRAGLKTHSNGTSEDQGGKEEEEGGDGKKKGRSGGGGGTVGAAVGVAVVVVGLVVGIIIGIKKRLDKPSGKETRQEEEMAIWVNKEKRKEAKRQHKEEEERREEQQAHAARLDRQYLMANHSDYHFQDSE